MVKYPYMNQDKVSLKDIQNLLKSYEMKLRIPFHSLTKKEKDILARTVKLSEEVGELSNDILAILSLQRESKLQKFNKKNLYEEFADVILSTIILANALKVDISRATKDKMKKVLGVYLEDRKTSPPSAK